MVMVDNQDTIETEEYKNFTEFIKVGRNRVKNLIVKASKFIPQLYEKLLKEG